MPVFGYALDPNLWLGELYATEPGGYIAQTPTGTRYLQRQLTRLFDRPTIDAQTWEQWQRVFYSPSGEVEAIPWRFERPEGRRPPSGAAGGFKHRVPWYSLLTFKQAGLTVIKGTETGGINIKQAGIPVLTGGTASVTVKEAGG